MSKQDRSISASSAIALLRCGDFVLDETGMIYCETTASDGHVIRFPLLDANDLREMPGGVPKGKKRKKKR